jgi:hypothetical protein
VSAESLQRLAALERYAKALQALTRAQDRADLDAAAGEFSTALGQVLAPLPQGAATVPVVSSVLFSLTGRALDHERYLALHDAVLRAHPAVESLSPAIVATLAAQRGERELVIQRTIGFLEDVAPRQAGATQRLVWQDTANERTAAVNGLRRTDPDAIGGNLVTAHAALRDALKDPARGFANARAAIDSFAREVAAWRESLGNPRS